VLDKEACRKRVMGNAHIFAGIIDACVKDGVAMLEEQDEEMGVEDDFLTVAPGLFACD